MEVKTLRKALTLAILAVASYSVQAAPIFSFTEKAGFQGGDVGVAVYSDALAPDAANPVNGPLFHTMSWVSGQSPLSSLVVATYAGALPIDTWVSISTVTHNNVIIPGATNWGPQDIWGRFIITDSDGAPAVVKDDEEAVTISLVETANNSNGVCPQNPPGLPGVPPFTTPCPDYFSILNASFSDLVFWANDGSKWKAEFEFGNFVGQYLDGNSLYTGESASSSVDVLVRVSRVIETPEPSTLGILGLGLVGLSLAKRRKANS